MRKCSVCFTHFNYLLSLFLQVKTLTEQVASYEQEIEQYDLVKQDWQTEKEALEDMMMSLRAELRQKDEALTVMEAQHVSACNIYALSSA